MHTFVFGPVPSRRLGLSLGIDVIPRKYCSFDCIYCQVGKTTNKEVERQRFFDPELIVRQVIERTQEANGIDVVSLSGSGEPTLNSDIGWILEEIKKRCSTPVTVITNGSLLSREDVRRDLMKADIVLPSLNAAKETLFAQINRPHPSLNLAQVVKGLKVFRQEYKGSLWLEIMLIKDVNDSTDHIEMLNEMVATIGPDKVQLNTVTRPPSESTAREVGSLELAGIAHRLGSKCEVIGTFEKRVGWSDQQQWAESVIAVLKRRSLSLDDVVRITGVSVAQAKRRLNRLVRAKRITAVMFNKRLFYVADE